MIQADGMVEDVWRGRPAEQGGAIASVFSSQSFRVQLPKLDTPRTD
jgi:hypothetical protein